MNQPFNTNGGIHEIPLPSGAGRLWLCGKHYIGPNVEEVLAGCDNAIAVCLVQEHELADRYPSYIEWHETHAGTRAIWNPIDDLSYPEFDEIFEFVSVLTDHLKNGQSLVVHCAAGIGRWLVLKQELNANSLKILLFTLVADSRREAGVN
jgi:protein-tyrosine phosphatase